MMTSLDDTKLHCLELACRSESESFSAMASADGESFCVSADSGGLLDVCAWIVGWREGFPRRVTKATACWLSLMKGDIALEVPPSRTRNSINTELTVGGSTRASLSTPNTLYTTMGSPVSLNVPVSTVAVTRETLSASFNTTCNVSTKSSSHTLFGTNTVLSYSNFKPRSTANNKQLPGLAVTDVGSTNHSVGNELNHLNQTSSSHVPNNSEHSRNVEDQTEFGGSVISNQKEPPVVVVGSASNSNTFESVSDTLAIELTHYMVDHLGRQADCVLASGRTQLFYALLGSLELVLAELYDSDGWQMDCHRVTSDLHDRLVSDLYAMHCQHISVHMCSDPLAQDWQQEVVPEDDTCSVSVRYWWVYMQGVYFDLCQSVSPGTTRTVMAQLLELSLGQLVLNYSSVSLVSVGRRQLFFMDLIAILLGAFELQLAIVEWPDRLFVDSASDSLQNVSAQCKNILLLIALRLSPLNLLSEHISNIVKSNSDGTSDHSNQLWLSLLYPKFVSPSAVNTDYLEPNVCIYMHVRCATAQFPSPNCWPLLLHALRVHDFHLTTLLLHGLFELQLQCPAPILSRDTKRSQSKPLVAACSKVACCGSVQCSTDLSVTQTSVCHALLLIVVRCATDDTALTSVLHSCLQLQDQQEEQQLFHHLWARSRRPLWLQALIDLVIPTAEAAVGSLVQDIVKADGNLAHRHSELLLASLLGYLDDLLEDIPASLLHVFCRLNYSFVKHLRFGLGTHILMCALYDTLNCESFIAEECCTMHVPNEKATRYSMSRHTGHVSDAVVAVGEQLCSWNQSQQPLCDQLLGQLGQRLAALDRRSSAPLSLCSGDSQCAGRLCVELVARDAAGRRALWTLGALLRHNTSWLWRRLGIQCPPAGSKPPSSSTSTSSTAATKLCAEIACVMEPRVFWPQVAQARIGLGVGCQLDGTRLLLGSGGAESDDASCWRHLLLYSGRCCSRATMAAQVARRVEFCGARHQLSAAERECVNSVSQQLQLSHRQL